MRPWHGAPLAAEQGQLQAVDAVQRLSAHKRDPGAASAFRLNRSPSDG